MKRPMVSQEEQERVMELVRKAKTGEEILAAILSTKTPPEMEGMFDERGEWIVEFEDDD